MKEWGAAFIAGGVASAFTDWLWKRRLRRTAAGRMALRERGER